MAMTDEVGLTSTLVVKGFGSVDGMLDNETEQSMRWYKGC